VGTRDLGIWGFGDLGRGAWGVGWVARGTGFGTRRSRPDVAELRNPWQRLEAVRGGCQRRPEGAELHSPGQRPGCGFDRPRRPERASPVARESCPFRANNDWGGPVPRALPWAIELWPFGPVVLADANRYPGRCARQSSCGPSGRWFGLALCRVASRVGRVARGTGRIPNGDAHINDPPGW